MQRNVNLDALKLTRTACLRLVKAGLDLINPFERLPLIPKNLGMLLIVSFYDIILLFNTNL